MAGEDKLSVSAVQPMPKIFDVNGEEMAPSDLKENDMLVVRWVEPAKYKAETSVVRFEKFSEVTKWTPNRVIFFGRADFEPLSVCRYPLEDISEIRFCAKSSSASSQVFNKLHEFYKENKRLWDRIERINKRLQDLSA